MYHPSRTKLATRKCDLTPLTNSKKTKGERLFTLTFSMLTNSVRCLRLTGCASLCVDAGYMICVPHTHGEHLSQTAVGECVCATVRRCGGIQCSLSFCLSSQFSDRWGVSPVAQWEGAELSAHEFASQGYRSHFIVRRVSCTSFSVTPGCGSRRL